MASQIKNYLWIGGVIGLTSVISVKSWSEPVSHENASTTESHSYTFNPLSVKRDPFEAPEINEKAGVNDLMKFDLNEMNLVAILSGMGRPQGMIVLPNGKTHIVQVGDLIGRHSGRIAKISDNEVIVKETFRDYQNRTRTSLTNLVLAQ